MNWRPRISHSSKPKYLAIVEALERDIISGTLRHGDRLPPQRDIATRVDSTIATVTKAFKEAARRGIVTARTGSGTFVRVGQNPTKSDRLVIDLSLNTVPIGPTKPFIDAALHELGRRHAADVLCSYEPTIGTESHRSSMAKWLKRRKLSARPGQTLLTHGGQHALAACFHALTRLGETVLCEEWSYSGIRRLADLCHVRIESVAMDEEGLDPGSLRERLKTTQAKLVFCTAVVQNPTTATMSLARRREILAICRKADALVVEDDIYGILSGEDLPPLAAIEPSRTVYVSSFSKCFSPGVRLGAIIAPEGLIPSLQNALTALHWTAPSLWAEMFALMSENGAADRCLAAHRREALRRLALYKEALQEAPGTSLPSYHVWQKLPASWRSEDFVSELLTRGVRVSPAQHFSVSQRDGNDFVRVCLGGEEDAGELKDQLLTLRELMRARPRISTAIT
jgi:DNA-binding transcriptional MocR family regulator